MNQRRSPQSTVKRKVRTYSHNDTLVKHRRDQIISVSCNIFAKKGFEKTSVRELAEGLDMTKGNLYHYLGAKNDILYLILDFARSEVQEWYENSMKSLENYSTEEAFVKAIQSYFAYVDKWQDMYNVINHVMVLLDKDNREIIYGTEEKIASFFTEMITRGIGEGKFKTDDAELIAHSIIITANAWANRRWFLRKRCNLKEYTETQVKIIMTSLGAG